MQKAVHEAVELGTVWLTNGPASVWQEKVPYGVLDDGAVLHPRPDPVPAQELVADALPGAWRDGATNGAALARALSQSRRTALPWGLVREGIRAGVESRWFEVADGSVAVNCPYDEAGQLRLTRPAELVDPPPPPPPPPGDGSATRDLPVPGSRRAPPEADRGERRRRPALPSRRGAERGGGREGFGRCARDVG